MAEIFLSDNSGNRVPPGCVAADPIAASGVKLYDATIGADIELTVVAGASYVITCTLLGGFKLGIADVYASDANVLWVATLYESVIIKIPVGITTLHYEGTASGATGYMRKLKSNATGS
jgi:hypothetical protein